MVRSSYKNSILLGILIATIFPVAIFLNVKATDPDCPAGAPADTQCEGMDFRVNVNEILSVSLTTPNAWAIGDVYAATGRSDLLRNKIVLNVASNNAAGFTASMASRGTTNLVNDTLGKSDIVIPTLASATTAANFPVNRWGYSIDDTDAGNAAANYAALQTSAITLANPTEAATVQKDIFFGAKADVSQASGTYVNTVVISVVSGVISNPDNPVTPVNPAKPEDDDVPDNKSATYDSTNDRTVYTTIGQTNDTTTIETQISKGDTTTSYVRPQGVTTTKISEGAPLAMGLAITAGVAGVSGMLFFLLAKRKKDEEDEE